METTLNKKLYTCLLSGALQNSETLHNMSAVILLHHKSVAFYGSKSTLCQSG